MTSRDVDNLIQRKFQTKKVGHLGTLDPFATGLLIVAVNKGTKFLPYLDDEKKLYRATLRLGVRTASGDLTGEPIEETDVPALSSEDIERVFSSFIGQYEQLPPMASAIKVDGVPLYKSFRKGKEVERKKRKVTIYELRLLSFRASEIEFEALVSKGTYVRTLGEDLSKALKTVGHLTELRRLSIGRFKIDDAKRISEITEKDLINPIKGVDFPFIEADEDLKLDALNGRGATLIEAQGAPRVIIVSPEGPLAVYRHEIDDYYVPERGLF